MNNKILSRRDLLERSLKTATALGFLGLITGNASDVVFSQSKKDEILTEADDILSFEPQAVCNLTCSQTLGPCYSTNPPVRQDITSGKQGMPMRLGFRVVDTECNPIPNVSVDIWHTDVNGVYSALQGFCANGDTTAPTQNFLRGVQLTDNDGWAYFDSIFPGWYPSRTTHIHATFRLNNTAIVTTQFYFLDRVSEYVYRNHPLYSNRPLRQTKNTNDNILGGNLNRMMPYIFSTKATANKSFRAWKTVVINNTPTSCNA